MCDDEICDYLKTKLETRNLQKYLKECKKLPKLSDISSDVWHPLKFKQFSVVHLANSKECAVIFKQIDKDIINKFNYHPYKCRQGENPLKNPHIVEYIEEPNVEIFCSHPVSERLEKTIKDKDPKIFFNFHSDYCPSDKKLIKQETLFVILMRLYNIDLHFDHVSFEIYSTVNEEKQELIRK